MHFPEFLLRYGGIAQGGEIRVFIHIEAVVGREFISGFFGHQFFDDRIDQVNIGQDLDGETEQDPVERAVGDGEFISGADKKDSDQQADHGK